MSDDKFKDMPVWIIWGHRASPIGGWNLSIAAIATSQTRAMMYAQALRTQEENNQYPYKVTIEESKLDHLYGFQDLEIAYELRASQSRFVLKPSTKGEDEKP
jgi:hypothetical protein